MRCNMKRFSKLLIILLILPLNVFAYSDKVIVGGDNIGIEVYSKGVYVVGFYDVNGKNIGEDAGFKIGDIITGINDNDIENKHGLNDLIEEDNTYTFTQKSMPVSVAFGKVFATRFVSAAAPQPISRIFPLPSLTPALRRAASHGK